MLFLHAIDNLVRGIKTHLTWFRLLSNLMQTSILLICPLQKCKRLLTTGFFLASTAEKTKTQGQNSSKKLKEKTRPLGATLLQFVKTQEKNSSFSKISKGTQPK